MSIFPAGFDPKSLTRKWKAAAFDLPVPESLADRSDAFEWRTYCECLSPAQLVRKLGQALDQYHELASKAGDPLKLPEAQQEAIYSKWHAAAIASAVVSKNFYFETEDDKNYTSEVDNYVYCIVDFLKSVNSADVPLWEARREKYHQLDNRAFHQLPAAVVTPASQPKPLTP